VQTTVDKEHRSPNALPFNKPRKPTPRTPETPTRRATAGWPMLAGLLLLGLFPLVFGALRVSQLAGGPEIMPANTRIAAAPLVIHIVGAFGLAVLGPFQFAAGLRRRHPGWHRLAGRLAVVGGLMAALSGLWMTLVYPAAPGTGPLLYVLRLLFGSAMIASIVLGFTTIRRGDVARHRAWITRGYAIGLGAGTQMLTLMVGEMVFGPPDELGNGLLNGAGWMINLAVAERAIGRRSAPPARAVVPFETRPAARHRGRTAVAVVLAAAVAVPGVLARPAPPSLSTAVTGDAALAERARPLLPGALDRVSIAVVDGASVTHAGFGADEHTEYEIGSLTKTFTAALLADAIHRGEVTADTKVGALLPLGGAPVADATLAELASHRSGLSAQGMLLGDTVPWALRYLTHRNPFTHDRDGLLAIACTAPLGERGAFVYSNLGVALLGHALAAAAGTEYDRLVEERLFAPLGMDESSLPRTAGVLPRGAPTGYSAAGVREAPWTIGGWAPAGGVRSNTADMVRYAQALLDGSAPGTDALDPRWQFGRTNVGYAWLTREDRGHTVTFTNGRTGGFTGKLVLDRANHRAVVVLSNTAAEVDTAADALLTGDNAWTPSR
jgi:CubicO group peptidase (beta-lactamase class C family)/uncharacterized membrane protein